MLLLETGTGRAELASRQGLPVVHELAVPLELFLGDGGGVDPHPIDPLEVALDGKLEGAEGAPPTLEGPVLVLHPRLGCLVRKIALPGNKPKRGF